MDIEAIVLRQYKIASGRRMIVLFSKAYGMISAGTSINEGGKSKAAAALRPFAHGKYRIRKTGSRYHINGCELIASHYGIGGDIDKYMFASMALEFTSKLLPEEAPAGRLYNLLLEFLGQMEKREKKFEILLLAYQYKALKLMGCQPNLQSCVSCGKKEQGGGFSVEKGGQICPDCLLEDKGNVQLIYGDGFDIVNVINFLIETPFFRLERLALDEEVLPLLREVLTKYIECHLDIVGLKAEEYLKMLE